MKSTFRPTRRFFLKQATTGALALGLFPLMGCAPAWGAAAKTPAAPGATGAAPAASRWWSIFPAPATRAGSPS